MECVKILPACLHPPPPPATGTNSLRAAGSLLSQPPLLTERNLRCVDTRNRTCSWVSTPPTRTDSKACVEKLVPGSTKVKMRSEAAAAAAVGKKKGSGSIHKLQTLKYQLAAFCGTLTAGLVFGNHDITAPSGPLSARTKEPIRQLSDDRGKKKNTG